MPLIINGHTFGKVDTSSPAFQWAENQRSKEQITANFAVFEFIGDNVEQLSIWMTESKAREFRDRNQKEDQYLQILQLR